MYRRPAAGLLAAALLTGCSASSSLPEVSGRPGERPVITPAEGEPRPEPMLKVLAKGRGPRIERGQAIVTNVDMRLWGGRSWLNTWDSRQPTTAVLDGNRLGKGWEAALLGRRPGDRVLFVTPARYALGPGGMSPVGVSPSDTMVEVFDIIGGYAPNAQVPGTMKEPAHSRLYATVVPGREPSVTVPQAKEPSRLTSQTLIEGTGPQIRPGSTFVTNYSAALWETGETFDSSYRRGGPTGFVLSPGSVPPGWEQALNGVRQGSRVMFAVPAALGKGFRNTPGGIAAPPGKTLVYVMDILDVRAGATR